MPPHHASGVVPSPKVHLTLHIKVDHTHNTVLTEQTTHRVDDRVELWDHREGVAQRHKLGTARIGVFIKVANGLRLGVGGEVGFVLMQAEGARILTNDFDILPAEALEALAGHFAKAWGQVDDV